MPSQLMGSLLSWNEFGSFFAKLQSWRKTYIIGFSQDSDSFEATE